MENNLEILNLKTMLEAKKLMGEKFPMIVKYFVEDTNMYFSEIQAGISNQNIQQALIAAHTIKSSAKQLGAERVSDIAKKIEFLARDMEGSKSENYTELSALSQGLKKEIELMVKALESSKNILT